MSFTDAIALDPGVAYRLSVQIRADNGVWGEFNDYVYSVLGGYGDAVVGLGSMGWKAEALKGLYVDTIQSITMRNDPYSTSQYGLWDQPLSRDTVLTVNGRPYSGWGRRLLRVQLTPVVNEYGASHTASTLGIYEIVDVRRSGDDKAVLKLRSLWDRLQKKSAASVKDGGSWYRGRSIGFLLDRLFASSLPPGVSTSVPSSIEMPAFTEEHTSSLGQTPGVLTNGTAAAVRWVLRCSCIDPETAAYTYHGFEVYGDNDRPDGAVARYDVTTRQWLVLAYWQDGAGESALQLYVPRAMHCVEVSGTVRLVVVTSVEYPISAEDDAHWQVREAVFNKATGARLALTGTQAWWPCRETVRAGVPNVVTRELEVGVVSVGAGGGVWRGFPSFFLMPQVTDNKGAWLVGSTEGAYYEVGSDYSVSHGPVTAGSDLVDTTDSENQRLHEVESVAAGMGYMHIQVQSGPLMGKGGFRYYMSDLWAGRPYMRRGNWWFVGKPTGSNDFRITALAVGGVDSATHYALTGLGDVGNQMWTQQITLFSPAANQTTTQRFYLARTESAGLTGDSVPIWPDSRLYLVTISGGSASLSTLFDEVTGTGYSVTKCRVFVDCFVPTTADDENQDTTALCVFVVADLKLAGGQAYGLWTGEANTSGVPTWSERFGESGYNGPVSSLPFSGFVTDRARTTGVHIVCNFVDQASGQVWELDYNTSTNASTFTPVNAGDPINSETHLASDRGLYTSVSGVVRKLWACAPDSAGDVFSGYWQRAANQPASQTYLPGVYPMVQMSTEQSDIVDVAAFGELDAKKAAAMLLQLAPTYAMGWVGTTLTVAKRSETADNSLVLVLERDEDGVSPMAGELPILDYEAWVGWDEARASVEVVPHAFAAAGEAQVRPLTMAGSTFRGKWVWASRTDRLMDVLVQASAMFEAGSTRYPPLMRWRVQGEALYVYLAQAASASATTIYVGGITWEGGEYYAGSVPIRPTGVLRVQDGSERDYTIVGMTTGLGGVTVTLSGAVGVDAARLAQVELTPSDDDQISDGPNGVATLSVAINSTVTSIAVSSVRQLRRSMAIRVDAELMSISRITGTTLTVVRGAYGTLANTHTKDTPVKAYVALEQPGRLYAVGATGIEVGIETDDATGAGREERQVSPGDGVRVTTRGYALLPMEHARRRATSSACTAELGEADLVVDDNPFIDFAKSLPMASALLADVCQPRMRVQCTIPLRLGLTPFTQVAIRSARIHHGQAGEVDYEVLGCTYDTRSKTCALDLRSLEPVTGSGTSSALPGAAGSVGTVIGAGAERRRS